MGSIPCTPLHPPKKIAKANYRDILELSYEICTENFETLAT
jgi:hypothetical protein